MTEAKSIQVIKIHPNAQLPKRATEFSGFFDIYAVEDTILIPSQTTPVHTGLVFFGIPPFHFIDVRIRSSMSLKHGLMLANGAGVLDSDYHEELFILIYSTLQFKSYTIKQGDRIAQIALLPLPQITFKEIPPAFDFAKRVRASSRRGGLGSTGR